MFLLAGGVRGAILLASKFLFIRSRGCKMLAIFFLGGKLFLASNLDLSRDFSVALDSSCCFCWPRVLIFGFWGRGEMDVRLGC